MVLYLHGFASSAKSTKAAFFADRCRQFGIDFRCPDLNEPDFATLTVTRMLSRVEQEIEAAGVHAVTLVGSSLGGAVAVLAAERLGAKISQLVLMAPAVMFAKPGHHLLPPERIDEWRRKGALPFFHYGDQTERLLHVGFYEDSLRYDPFAAVFTQPTLIFQGLRDQSVPARLVEEFSASRRHVTLALLDDDHQLVSSLPRIWTDTEAFLGLVD